ncbi:hypothetical protein [Cellulomonas sp. HZM]|uniref:hypothetical protein n=1 Tax=Cellulomonas sp. HZM TaxID=1454010 RepID=UPI0004939B20|nr:hypothetical protein [Cellulomonas sp. HZM]
MTSPRHRLSRVLLASGLCVAALTLTACSATNEITTENEYSASDGVRATLGDVRASNLLVVSEAKGAPGQLHGALTNDGDEPESITFTFGTETAKVDVPAGETVLINGDANGTDDNGAAEDTTAAVTISSVSVAPGAVLPATLTSTRAGSQTLSVPVLDGTLPEYSTAPTA